MHNKSPIRYGALLAAVSAASLALAACGSSGTGNSDTITLEFANSYSQSHPHNKCGAQLVKKKIENQDLGMNVEVYPNSQLGGDTERFSSVKSGDIDMDLQGGSALSTSFQPIGVVDMFYAFDGPDALFKWFDSEASAGLKQDFAKKTNARMLGVWFFGMRDFTANTPIRKPEDLQGLRIRFPDSPSYLESAKALDANATPVAFEELYVALQRGTVDGQENPISTIASKSLNEVQDYVSLTDHQTGAQFVVISGDTWNKLSSRQQEALGTAVKEVRAKDRQCIEDARDQTLTKWRQSDGTEVVNNVDREAFKEKVRDYFRSNLKGRQLQLYEKAISY